MTILDAMRDPALFGRWFQGDTWDAWFAYMAALFALPMTAEQLKIYREHTGRSAPPTEPFHEAWVVGGRRMAKTLMAALVAVYLAAFQSWRGKLAPGEVAVVMLLAADRRQARVAFRYVRAFVMETPMLARMVVAETKESIEFSNGSAIEICTSSFRSVRGYSCAAIIADEVAFWPSDDSANADIETINALRPSLATTGGLLLGISSPYSRRGILWEMYRRHYGVDGAPTLVWQSASLDMNPTIPLEVIQNALEQDESAARAEWFAEFRRDIESFVPREAVDACIVPGRLELPPVAGMDYQAFTDPSGGSRDSMTLAVSHHGSDGRVVLDAVRESRPPFSPADVVAEFAEVLRSYGISTVTGDRYAGEWVREPFREAGIWYELAAKPKSDIYRDFLPLLNSAQVELLDHRRLVSQLVGLERRTARSGRDSIDHAPNGHDDVINAAAGALVGHGRRPGDYGITF